MAVTREDLEFKIGVNSKELVDSLDKLMAKTKGLDGATDDLQVSLQDLSKTEKEYIAAINKANGSTASSLKAFEDTAKSAEKMNEAMTETSVVAGTLKATFAAVATAFAGVAGFSVFKTISQEGMNLEKIVGGLKDTFRSVFSGISDNVAKAGGYFSSFKLQLHDVRLSIADLYKLLAVGGISLGSLASGIDDSTLASLALAQTLNFSSAALIALSLAIRIVLVAVGTFIEAIGDRIITAMDAFAEKFAKAQQIAVQFGFVIANFGKAYGPQFIGTLSQWEAQIERLAETSTFSGGEIRKATKLIIAENQALGLSYEENVKFLDRAVEIASSSGLELIDVVQRLQSAMLGNSTAVAALGINLSSHAIEHSELNKTMQKTVGTMSSLEKQQIALAEIYRQTEPLVGAAIVQGQTIIGINKQIANTYGSIQSKLGSVNVFSIELSKTYAGLLRSVDKLPDTFFQIFGALTDLLGVTLKVVGITVQWLLIIGGLTTAYKLLNIAIATNLAFQTALNAAFARLGLSLAINVTAVTSAATAFTVLTTLLKGGFMIILANVGKVLVGVTAKILAFTGAILVNPIFLGGIGIALAVAAVVKALQELNDEFQIIKISMIGLSDVSDLLSGVFTVLGTVLAGTFNAFVQSIKIVILSLAQLYNYAIIARAALNKMFNPSGADAYDKRIDDSLEKLDTLTAAHERSLDAMAFGFLGVNEKIALQAKYLDQAGKATDELAFKQAQLQKAGEAVDVNTIRIDILGTEVEKLTNRYTVAAKEVQKFSQEILTSTDVNTEAVKNYQQALADQAAAGFQLDKMRIDSLKGLAQITKDIQNDILKNNEDETLAIIAGFDDRREAVKEFEKVLANLGPVSTEAASKIKAAYKTIETAQRMALSAAQKRREDEAIAETIKVIKEEADALKTIAERNREIGKAIAGERLTAQQKIVSDLQIELQSLDDRLYLERVSRGNNSEIVKALELQKTLLVQNAEVQKRMTDMEVPDWIEELGLALERAFAFEAAQNFFSYIRNQIDNLNNSDLVINIKRKITETKESLGMGDGGSVSNAMSSVGDAITKAGDVASAAGGVLISGIAKAGGWVGQAIDVIMNADKYLKALIDMPKQLLQIIKQLPALVQSLIDQFPGMITKLAEALPGVLLKLVDMIPNLVAALIDAIPVLIERLAEALPEILVKLVAMIPKLLAMLGRGMFLAIQALIKGLIRGISNLFKGIKMPRVQIETKGIEKIGQKLAGSASRLFQVKDLTEAARDPIEKMTTMLEEAFKKGGNWIKEAWNWVNENIIKPIWAVVTKAWRWVYDNVIEPIIDVVTKAWRWVYDNVIQPIVTVVQKAFQWVVDKILTPIAGVVKDAFQWVVDKVLTPLAGVVKEAWQFVVNLFNSLVDTVKIAFEFVRMLWLSLVQAVQTAFSFVKNLWDGLVNVVRSAFKFVADLWDALVNVVRSAFESPKALFESLKNVVQIAFKFVADLWDNFSGTVSRAFQFVKDIWDNLSNVVSQAFSPIAQLGTQIWNGLKAGLDGASNIFSNIGSQIWEGLKSGLSGIGNFLTNIFDQINPANLFSKIFRVDMGGKGTVEKALGVDIPFMAFAEGGMVPGKAKVKGDSFANDRILAMLSPGEAIIPRSKMDDPNVRALVDQILSGDLKLRQYGFGGTLGKIIDEASKAGGQVVSGASGVLQDIGEAGKVLVDQVSGIAQGAGDWLGDVFNDANPLKALWKTVEEKVFKDMIFAMLKGNRFALGGPVVGTDTVPALLTPGEFVMSRPAVQSIGLDNLRAMNNGSSPGGSNTYNMSFSINVDAKTPMDEGYIRGTLIPRMSEELKRASLDGKFVLSQKGIR